MDSTHDYRNVDPLKHNFNKEQMELWHRWKFIIGVEGDTRKKLTNAQLIRWIKNPKRKLTCVFCGPGTIREDKVTTYCNRCREYKGVQPQIAGWNDWGEGN